MNRFTFISRLRGAGLFMERLFRPLWRKLVLIVVLLAAFGVLVNYWQLRQKAALARDPQKYQAAEARRITRQLGRLVVLPKEDNPKIATIISAEAARKQNPQFYAKASDGDIVVIFSDVAYLYNPNVRRIVNMGPVYSN